MVRDWGFSPKLGPIGYGGDDEAAGNVYQAQQARPYAEGTQQIIDQEVSRMLVEAEKNARQLLVNNRAELDAVVALLLKRETISGADLVEAVSTARSHADRQPALSAP
jgi:cell division protease FtsH